MRTILTTIALTTMLWSATALAHGDQPHPTCKKGYVLTDDHKCVRAPG